MVCVITGKVTDAGLAASAGALVEFVPNPADITVAGENTVVPKAVSIVATEAGEIYLSLLPGGYVMVVRDGRRAYTARVAVPDAASADLENIVDAKPTEVTLAEVGQLVQAAEAAQAAAEQAAADAATRNFKDLPTLLANTSLAYGPGAQQVAAGDVIRTRAEGFSYEVAAPGASDHHLTTAGGVKLYVLPVGGRYVAAAFGGNLAKAFEISARAKTPLVLEGAYTVTSSLLNITSGDAELHIVCAGDVVVTVDPGSDYIRYLIVCETDSVSSGSITGGSLTIVGNDKIGSGVTIRHLADADGGLVNFACPVKVMGCSKEVAGSYENWGIGVLGRFKKISMNNPTVEGVTRLSSAGFCSGIIVSGFVGDVDIRRPNIKQVFTGPGTVDADGIKCIGYARNGLTAKRDGRVRIWGPYFEDCQGRSYKSQSSDDVVYSPVVRRNASVAVGTTDSVEFDFQVGNGRVVDPRVEYYADGATSPLGASHAVAAFQQLLTDEEMHGRLENLTIVSDVAIPRVALAIHAAGTADSVVAVDGVTLLPANGLTTTMVSRAVVEFDASDVVAKTAKSKVIVRGVNGPNTWPLIGYTGYDGSSNLTSKLSWDVTDCNNPLGPAGGTTRAFHNLSDSAILAVEQFRMFGLSGYRNLYTGAIALDFGALTDGTVITVDIADVDATNPPPWGVSGYARIRCEGCYFGTTDRTVWVVKGNGSDVWFTGDGGSNWGTIK